MPCKNILKTAAFGNLNCGQMVQGGIRLCANCLNNLRANTSQQLAAAVKAELPTEELPEKRDFENLDVRLYLVIRDLRKIIDDGIADGELHSQNFTDKTALEAMGRIDNVMRDFEDSHGPLPEWAVARNFGLELVVGTQLITRDGRRHGNGWLVKISDEKDFTIADRSNPYGEWKAYYVLTDSGSLISKMTEQELESGFEVGDWICTLNRIVERFDHDKVVRELEEPV